MQQYIHSTLHIPNHGIFFIEKKDSGLRLFIDYRGLNDILVKYLYPLPMVPSAQEQVKEANVFTRLDLRSAYIVIHIKPADKWKTAFSTMSRPYHYQVMP